MSENARYMGEEIKIGTCENMYYLRAGQANLVLPMPNNVDPIVDAAAIRFRFPWPDEDHIAPGQFERSSRAVAVHGVTPPVDFKHGHVQFLATSVGYNVCLPCPESPEGRDDVTPYKVHRNGFVGAVRLVQQRVWDGLLVIVCECTCGVLYRVETLEQAQPIIDAFLKSAEDARHRASISPDGPNGEDHAIAWNTAIAERVEAGYTSPPEWVRSIMTSVSQ